MRHGDKYTDGSKILRLADYVCELRQRYPRLKRVWLMTEDASVISQATHDYPEYDWFFTSTSRDNSSEHGRPLKVVDAISQNAMINLFVAADAVAVVGTLTSTWMRLVIMLAWGIHHKPPDCHSLDGGWADLGFGGCSKFDRCTTTTKLNSPTKLNDKVGQALNWLRNATNRLFSSPQHFTKQQPLQQYDLAFMPPKPILSNGFPPTNAIVRPLLRKEALQDADVANASFFSYRPSTLEQQWIDHVQEWQDDVCAHTQLEDIAAWLGAVRQAMLEPKRMLHITESEAAPLELRSSALSVFTYHAVHVHRGHVYVHVPIEPTMSIARDPRKCWEPMTERYTQSKDHLLPVTRASALVASLGAVSATAPRAYLFDAGATIPSSSSHLRNGWTGTFWLWEWYRSRGISFDKVFAWEPRHALNIGELHLDPAFKRALVFHNRGCTSQKGHADNPLTVVRQHCRPQDFCVFKLDIDTASVELAINAELLTDSSLIALIDEYYYEHHVRNKVMAMHIPNKPTLNVTDLRSWYNMATAARMQGLRMHYWP